MMTAEELKSAFSKLIANGKLEEGFNLLDITIDKTSDIWTEQIVLIQGQLSNLDREYNVGIVKRDDYKTEYQSITYRISNTIKKLVDSDVAPPKELKNAVLIICRNSDDEFYIRSFCNQKRGLTYDVKQLKAYEEPTDYRFIIFDNHSVKNIEDKFELKDDELAHLKLMETYIEEYSEHLKFMIHFGEMTDVVSKNRDIIYSANSKFSLYSRIKEMEQYIEDDLFYKKQSA